MTVRAWFTISTLVLVALVVAIFIRLLAPVGAPPVLARVGDTRLSGARVKACWPQRGGHLRCQGAEPSPRTASLPKSGSLRIVVAYPAQPPSGTITIVRGGHTVLTRKWNDMVHYKLKTGTYELVADAQYPQDAYIKYRFTFRAR